MHGLPCSALQYCFGGPPDVSADSAPYLDPEISKTGPDRVMGLTVLTQPGPINPVRTDSQPSFSCVSIQTKTNGTNFITKELGSENQDTLHSYPSSEGLSEEDDAQDKSPVVDTKRPHIPRPSIIRPQKEHPIQDSLPVRTDHTEPEDGPLSGTENTHTHTPRAENYKEAKDGQYSEKQHRFPLLLFLSELEIWRGNLFKYTVEKGSSSATFVENIITLNHGLEFWAICSMML
ncbi:uncharacterized protein LOC122148677 [Cyprinus carpio]|uniref:Uncharacterized protein LOC122148677 n=1 Tax=Cyprinus carpio TaxID=7962 RepID=A0A9Q9Z4D6_CYPCA|nr:uncharacterized protein LOC122148677 [Cyprinus carpio]